MTGLLYKTSNLNNKFIYKCIIKVSITFLYFYLSFLIERMRFKFDLGYSKIHEPLLFFRLLWELPLLSA